AVAADDAPGAVGLAELRRRQLIADGVVGPVADLARVGAVVAADEADAPGAVARAGVLIRELALLAELRLDDAVAAADEDAVGVHADHLRRHLHFAVHDE